jgi:hypothetical protein
MISACAGQPREVRMCPSDTQIVQGSGSTHVPPASSTTGRMLLKAVHRTPAMAPAAASTSWLWHVSRTGLRSSAANALTSDTASASTLSCSTERPPGTMRAS